MSQKLAQNRIIKLAEALQKEKKDGGIEPSEIEDKETRDMVMWYLHIDKGKGLTDIAVLLQCERRTVAGSVKRIRKQRALQLEKEGIDQDLKTVSN